MTVYKTLPGGVCIVEYEPDLAQAVADMWNVSGDSWGGNMSIETAADIATEIGSGGYLNVYLAVEDGVVLGYASLSKYFRDDRALYLHVLNVRPDRHGQKLGKALVLQCVERTIELGYPRLDIHTWPGNTKSVPLYKKCGYMWEDRTDSTHLVNFIPTAIAAEASRSFFEKADWYEDSTRVIEVKPDGVKQNGFEVFRYVWEKDGTALAAGFERTGRRMRLLETDDYRIEMTAEAHELAFGLEYDCAFEVENKSGQPLQVRIQGKDDGPIRFEYNADEAVAGSNSFKAKFFAGEITEPQDIWQVHPCVLADIYINGLHAEFGMGIEIKFPVTLTAEELKKVAVPGAVYDCYFNLTGALLGDAEVTVRLPKDKNAVTRFNEHTHTVQLPKLGKTCVKVEVAATGYGHEAIPVEYNIKLSDGRELTFTRLLHLSSRGFTGACAYETETDYIIQNGLWQLGLNKNGAHGWTNHVYDAPGGPGFPIGQLGKPYRDEFERMKPVSVTTALNGDTLTMEAAYRSANLPSVEYVSIYTLSASGVFTRRHRVKSDTAITLTLKDETHASLGQHTVLPFNGGVQTIRDGLVGEASLVDTTLIDENWIYEDDPRWPRGLCWPATYKLNIRWGDGVFFEHDITLSPGESYETEPVILVHGHFNHFNDFRDYARQTYTLHAPLAMPHIDWTLNGGNPFADTALWTAKVNQHRNERLEGDIRVTSDGVGFTETGERAYEAKRPGAAAGGAPRVTLHMDLKTFDKTWEKIIFTQKPSSTVQLNENDGIFTADNGVIAFKADPRFSDACYSLMKDGHEWLMSGYPSRAPFAWFNPFIGGLHTQLEHMGDAMTVREPITAAFAEETDTLGNVWQGIATTVCVDHFEEHKGLSYTQYYLTRPGLPVLCYFIRLTNRTGLYKKLWLHTESFVGNPEGVQNLIISAKDTTGISYRYRVGADSIWRSLDRLVKAEAEQAEDRLYFYRDTTGAKPLNTHLDIHFAAVNAPYRAEVENDAQYTGKPLFVMLTPEALCADALTDLDRVYFK